jgi:hypothetical protein
VYGKEKSLRMLKLLELPLFLSFFRIMKKMEKIFYICAAPEKREVPKAEHSEVGFRTRKHQKLKAASGNSSIGSLDRNSVSISYDLPSPFFEQNTPSTRGCSCSFFEKSLACLGWLLCYSCYRSLCALVTLFGCAAVSHVRMNSMQSLKSSVVRLAVFAVAALIGVVLVSHAASAQTTQWAQPQGKQVVHQRAVPQAQQTSQTPGQHQVALQPAVGIPSRGPGGRNFPNPVQQAQQTATGNGNPLVQGAIQVIEGLFQSWFQAASQWITDEYTSLVDWEKGQAFIYQTGQGITIDEPTVSALLQNSIVAVDALLGLAVIWTSFLIMYEMTDPLQAFSRLILIAVVVNAIPTFLGLAIQINNILCASVLQVAGLDAARFTDIVASLTAPVNSTNLPVQLILMGMAYVLFFEDVMRIGLLDLLFTLTPFIGLLLLSPLTQRYAGMLFSAAFVTLYLQFVQVTALVLGARLVAVFNGPTLAGGFVGIALLTVVVRIPTWMGNAITGQVANTQDFTAVLQELAAVVTSFI